MKSIFFVLFVNFSIMAAELPKPEASLLETTETVVKVYGGICPDFPCEPDSISHWKFRGKISGKKMERLISLLEKFPILQRLDLEENPITDEDIDLLVKSKIELVEINLDKTKITDKSLSLIAERYPGLNSLGLNLTAITDKGLKVLEPLDLYYLHLGGTRITDEGMKSIACFVNLRDLNISQTRVTGKGLAAMIKVELESETFKTFLLDHRSAVKTWLAEMNGFADTDNYPQQSQSASSAGEFEIDLLKLQIKDVSWVKRGRGVQSLERLWWARSRITYVDLFCLQVCSPKRILFQARADF